MRRAGLCAALLLAAAGAPAQGPSADWRTVETVHFRIHYPAPFSAWALHAAAEIESIHAAVTKFVGYAPPRKIEIIVSDPAADSNGVAVPWLDRPEILLWTTPPESESSIGDYGDWMELLAAHEVAHVVHLTRPRDRSSEILWRLSPAPFGPLALGSPRWVIEGYATLVEGALTGSGRPGSTYRAMVLRRLGMEGKLPEYSELDDTDGWLGGSIAYLVGSAYLEWLAEREGPDALPNLWRRMASMRGGGFSASFRAVFGEAPRTLYDRFRAETTANAIEEEKRLKEAGLVDGRAWQRFRGGTLSAQVSPDGTRMLARRDPTRRQSELAIWTIAGTDGEPRSEAAAAERGDRFVRDVTEAADRRESRSRPPSWRLPRENGYAASDPRWMPGGRAVLFSRRGPDAEGTLRWDLYRWDFEEGAVAALTRGADAGDADPSPSGDWAVAVRGRYGRTSLVRIGLVDGSVSPIVATLPTDEEWPVWSHPRVSPEGRRIAALLHANGRWRLVTLPSDGGPVREIALDASPVSAPAWSPDGTRIYVATGGTGIWNVAAVDAEGGSPPAVLTRATGGAFGPAPSPDGRTLYFLDFEARGVSVRSVDVAPECPVAGATASSTRPGFERPSFATEAVPPSTPYSPWQTLVVRPLLDFSFGPSGNTVQVGADASDVLGRVHGLAAGSMGDAAGPRGGSIAAAYRGLPVTLTAQLFSAIEKPGNQGLAPRPAFDEERGGGFLEAAWSRPWSWGRVETRLGVGGSRVEAFAPHDVFSRVLGSGEARLVFRRTRGGTGFGLEAALGGSAGSTDASAWTQWSAGGRLIGILPFARISAAGRYGETGGSPSRFDLYAIGGAPSAIMPPGLDPNRIGSPALPADVQVGRRFEAYRAELDGGELPVAVYGDWMRAWGPIGPRPDPVRVVGAEVRLERLIPPEYGRTVSFHVGVGWISSRSPEIHTARGYAQLLYRP